jgi:hypothetical protein
MGLPFKKYEIRLFGPAHRAGGHDEPGLLAFNGCRFGGLGKNRRNADRTQSGGTAEECGVFAHRWLL